MKILRGFVVGVIEKQGKNSKYAVVGINSVSKTRSGFDETTLFEFMVAGNDYSQGVHTAYRQHQGAEVFAPFADEIDNFNGKYRIRYSLTGAPVRIQDIPEQSAPKPAPTAVAPAASQQPAKTA